MIIDPHFFIPIARAAAEATSETSSGPVGALGLNLKLFIAQLINFAVVLFVLWKWVFTPVAKKLQERTDKIEKSMNDADRITKEKDEFGKWRENEMVKVRSQASALVTAAESQAQKSKEEILNQAKQEQSSLLKQTQLQILQEKDKAISDIKSEVANMVTIATEKLIKTKLDSSKDKELIQESLKNL